MLLIIILLANSILSYDVLKLVCLSNKL